MSLVQPTQPPAVLVGIDIAKLRHDVLIGAPGWKSRKRMILPNTAAEVRLFADLLHDLKHSVSGLSSRIASSPASFHS